MKHVNELLEVLDLEQIEINIFRGNSHDMGSPNVFGGQVLSQALHSAMLTVSEERIVHSMHAYFILAGDKTKPIIFNVERLRDGGSFSTRRVTAIQRGKAIFNLAASFQLQQSGMEHQFEMPKVTPPEELQSDQEMLKSFEKQLPEAFKKFIRPRPIEFRPVNPLNFILPEKQEPCRYVWFRAVGDVEKDIRLNQRLLAYASDYNLLSTAVLPHQDQVKITELQMASLDHAMWFHHEFNICDWLLYALDSPSTSNSRGFTRGNIFTKEGKLVASVVQEGLLRKPRKRS